MFSTRLTHGAGRLLTLAAALLLLPAASQARQAPAERESAAKMIDSGNYSGAVEVLKGAVKKDAKADAEAWYHLGAAYTGLDDPKEARKAFEKAIKLRPDWAPARAGLAAAHLSAGRLGDAEHEARRALGLDAGQKEAHYVLGAVALRRDRFAEALERAEGAMRADPDYPSALLLKVGALVGLALNASAPPGPDGDRPDLEAVKAVAEERRSRLDEAGAALERLVRLKPDSKAVAGWREQLEAVRLYAKAYDPSDPTRTVFRGTEVTQRAVIHDKPEPEFTPLARSRGTSGVVRLRLVLAADGEVKHILVVRGLPNGLTEASIRAARRIRFTPAVKDGRPVSTAVMVEYGFHIY